MRRVLTPYSPPEEKRAALKDMLKKAKKKAKKAVTKKEAKK